MSNNQVVTLSGVLPSYLDCFEKDKIHLILAKKPSIASESEECIKQECIKQEDESFEKFDVTGDPLQVDLGENDSIQIYNVEDATHRWTTNESKHFPFSVRTGRKEINQILKKKCEVPENSLVYILCNADDVKKTVLLGCNSKSYMVCSVHVVGILPQEDVEENLKEMVDDHLKNCYNGSLEIKYLVKMTYNLYGKSLRNNPYQNDTMRQLSTHGNISVDIISPKKVFKIAETDEGQMKVHLELVAGHQLLTLNFLWYELFKLQQLIDIMSNSMLSNCEETVICKEPLDPDVILQLIAELLLSRFLKRERSKEVVDLDNLRQEGLLDALWNVLLRCESIFILRNSFNFLFEELAERNITILPIKDDCSKISGIIKGILQRKISLPTISFPECVELLFELGAQKLKFDFQVILAQFSSHIHSSIDSVWKALYQRNQQETKNFRRTRAPRNTGHIGIPDVTVHIKLLAYLSQLYIGSEFIYLLKDQVNLNDDCFHHFCRSVEKEYVAGRNLIKDFNEIYQCPLNHMSFEVDLRNASIVESMFPSRWTMIMESGRQTTIYDLADSPIFPPAIYEYDVPIANTEEILYYVSKMSRSTGLF